MGSRGNSCDAVANSEKQSNCGQKEAVLSAQETLLTTIMNLKTI